jgi:hypothetical protein
MAMTTKPKPGAMADSAQSIMNRAAKKEQFRGLKEKILQSPPAYKTRKPGPATPRPPKKPVGVSLAPTTSPLPPKKPATNYIQGKK